MKPSNVSEAWARVCELEDIVPDAGVCALVAGRQIAVFRVDDAVYAIDNADPASGANVLSRGIVGDIKGELVVASPLYKHHYALRTGRCLEDPGKSVNVYPVRVEAGQVWVDASALRPACTPAKRRRLVVIGNGMTGTRAGEELSVLAPRAIPTRTAGPDSAP